MQPAIVVEDLSKLYTRRKRGDGLLGGLRAYFSFENESVPAVQGLTFRLARGESVGLIGENGAGKSTTIKMLTGILVPTTGTVSTLGFNPWKQRRRLAMNIGVVFGQKPQLLWDISAGESFKLLKAMYAIPNDIYRYTHKQAIEQLEIGDLLKTPVRLLSLGQRMRCELAAALLHAPAVAFLDEPTIGLDVVVKERVRDFLREMQRRFGMTIVLTTHDLRDIAVVSDRLLVLDGGRLLYDGDLPGFTRRFGGERTLRAELEVEPSLETREAIEREARALGARLAWDGERRVRIGCPVASMAPQLTGLLIQHLAVRDLAMGGAEMETVVAQLYRQRPSA